MKVVAGSIVSSALRSIPLALVMMGVAGAAYAQSDSAGAAATNGTQPGAGTNAAVSTATRAGGGLPPGAAATPGPGMGGVTGSGTGSVIGGVQAAPALNNMRANGTALYMSPDPRAPNLTGRAAPAR